MRKLLFVALLLFSVAAEGAPVDKPPEIADVIEASVPYGAGTYKWTVLSVYDATLWTDASPWSMQAPFALCLHYSMHFSSDALVKRSVEEMEHIRPLSAEEKAYFAAQLPILFPDVKTQDVITALYVPHHGARFYHNGVLKGTIKSDAYAQRFFSIWFSEQTSAPELRRQLLVRN